MGIHQTLELECADRDDGETIREMNRAVSSRLLARLLKHHGDNPPDADAAKAAADFRKHFAKPNPAMVEPSPSAPPIYREFVDDSAIYGTGDPAPVFREITRQVAEKHGISFNRIFARRKTLKIVYARQEAMSRCVEETGYSLPAIGRFFDRDHTTVINACKSHKSRMEKK